MNITASTLSLLQSKKEKYFVVTLLNNYVLANKALDTGRHFCLLPSSVSLSTDSFLIDGTPVYGCILEDIVIEDAIDVFKKTTNNISVSFSFINNFGDMFLDPSKLNNLVGRIDYYVKGMRVDQLIKRVVGRATINHAANGTDVLLCQISDESPTKEISYPLDNKKLDYIDFPSVPLNVRGKYPRHLTLNQVDYPILCPAINNGTSFYVCDNDLVQAPSEVTTAQGQIIPKSSWRVTRERVENSIDVTSQDSRVTVITVNSQLDLTLPYILVSGVVGLYTNYNPILFLLDTYGKYRINPFTKILMAGEEFDQSLQIQNSESVLKIASDRIVPQTSYMMTSRKGELVLLPIYGKQTSHHLSIGNGLFGRTATAPEISDLDYIANSVEISYRRNPFSVFTSDSSEQIYIVSRDRNSSGTLQNKLKQSYDKYGHRPLQVPAPDIYHTSGNPNDVPPQIRRLAVNLLEISHCQYKMYEYLCDIETCFTLDINDILYISDASENFNMQECRLVKRKESTGNLVLTFMVRI